MIPPPPTYPPPHAPSSSPRLCLPARLEHLGKIHQAIEVIQVTAPLSPGLCVSVDLVIPAPPLWEDPPPPADHHTPPQSLGKGMFPPPPISAAPPPTSTPPPAPVTCDCSSPVCAVVALYNYEASQPDGLSMKEGDIICLIHRHGDGWCEGILRGNRGFFPENYVQACD